MDSDLIRFLKQKGSMEILCVLPTDGLSKTELDERVRITDKTVKRRLDEGEDLDLWDRVASHRDVDARYDYLLTEYGQHVKIIIAFHQLPVVFSELRMKEEEFERRKDTVLARITEHGTEGLLEMYGYDGDS